MNPIYNNTGKIHGDSSQKHIKLRNRYYFKLESHWKNKTMTKDSNFLSNALKARTKDQKWAKLWHYSSSNILRKLQEMEKILLRFNEFYKHNLYCCANILLKIINNNVYKQNVSTTKIAAWQNNIKSTNREQSLIINNLRKCNMGKFSWV